MKIFLIATLLQIASFAASDKLTFLSPVAFSPWASYEKSGKPVGHLYEVSKIISKHIEEDLVFKITPFKKFSILREETSFDITFINITKDKMVGYSPIGKEISNNETLLIYSKKLSSCREIESLATVLGKYAYSSVFTLKCGARKTYNVKSLKQRLKMLRAKRVDALVLGQAELNGISKEERKELKQKYKFQVLSSQQSFIYVRNKLINKRPKLMKKISNSVDDITKYFESIKK